MIGNNDWVHNDRIAQLDSAVSELFETMLKRSCVPVESEIEIDQPITARIRFSGSLTGECVVYASKAVAQATAAALLGPVAESSDSMSEDALGELCNMIAGGWKSKLESREATCLISLPSVSYDNYAPFDESPVTVHNRQYSSMETCLELSWHFRSAAATNLLL